MRICERWGQRPDWFDGLDRDEQMTLLAYEEIRQAQEHGDIEES